MYGWKPAGYPLIIVARPWVFWSKESTLLVLIRACPGHHTLLGREDFGFRSRFAVLLLGQRFAS